MSASNERPSLESVLDAFSVESKHDRSTLEHYLWHYPEYAIELVDLSRELSLEVGDDLTPLLPIDKTIIDSAWSKYVTTSLETVDPFAALTPDNWRAVARRLDVPRQVVTAIRERRILLESIPRVFLRKLAEAMNSSVSLLELFSGASHLSVARSYKADAKPTVGEQVTLEQVLTEAGIPAEKRERLLAETD